MDEPLALGEEDPLYSSPRKTDRYEPFSCLAVLPLGPAVLPLPEVQAVLHSTTHWLSAVQPLKYRLRARSGTTGRAPGTTAATIKKLIRGGWR